MGKSWKECPTKKSWGRDYKRQKQHKKWKSWDRDEPRKQEWERIVDQLAVEYDRSV